MLYTDIVKARALRRAGRACEMCGTPVGFESGQFVAAQPIFGILFDQDDCCVLCGECLAELDPDTRGAALQGPRRGEERHEARIEPPTPIRGGSEGPQSADGGEREDARPERRETRGPRTLPRGGRESRLPHQDPDGGMCA